MSAITTIPDRDPGYVHHVLLYGAMEKAGVRRLIHLSALGAGADERFPYLRSKWLGEEAVRYFERSAWLRAVAGDENLAWSARFAVDSATALERVYLPGPEGWAPEVARLHRGDGPVVELVEALCVAVRQPDVRDHEGQRLTFDDGQAVRARGRSDHAIAAAAQEPLVGGEQVDLVVDGQDIALTARRRCHAGTARPPRRR